jgi:hypothetical protein
MKHLAINLSARPLAMLLALLLALLVAHGGAHAEERPALSPQELERTLAPIALYPDPLLSQILMASTYPLEVVEAARWSRSHANLAGEDAVRAAGNEYWDPSVKSLLAFPQVLARMDENLQWLQTLGDAFLGQEPQVMDTVQNLRRRAQAAGNLRSDERQRNVESGPLLVVQPADPQIIYVPYYDPRVVYGPWWWPNHTPVYWRPFPGYYTWPGLASSYFWGPSIRISANYFFGGFDWHRRHVKVVQHNYYYGAARYQRAGAVSGDRPPGAWQHDPVHRRGVAYRGPVPVPRLAAANPAPEPARHADREDARRKDGQRGPAYPALNRSADAGRPVVPAVVQPNEPVRVQAAIRPLAQPSPPPDRPGEPRGDVRRAAVQPAAATPAPPEIRRASLAPAQAGTDARADRRDQVRGANRGDRGERREPAEPRQATHTADAAPQTQWNRGHATPPREPPQAPPHGDRAGRDAKPRAGESGKEATPSASARQEGRR